MTKRALLALCAGVLVAAPAAAQQRTPTAHCYDGTYYYGTNRREACARHRGVSEWLGAQSQRQLRATTPRHRTPQAKRPAAQQRAATPRTAARARPAPPRGATAHCKDGTWSRNPRRAAACVGHGGISRWLGRR